MEVQDVFYEKYRKKRNLIIVILIFLMATVLVSIVFGLNYLRVEKAYTSNLIVADKYYANNQYEAAIMAYQLSIQEKPDEEEPYLRMAEIYVLMGDFAQVENVLKEGYSQTRSSAIYDKMQRIYLEETVGVVYTEEEMSQMAEDVTVNNTVFDWIASYTYTDYVSQFGNARISNGSIGLVVAFDGFPGQCSYFNTNNNNYIVDSTRNLPYANRKPNYVTLNSISGILNQYAGAVSRERLNELFGDNLKVEALNDPAQYWLKFVYRNCEVEMECDVQGNIVGQTPQVRIKPLYEGEIEKIVSEDAGKHVGYVNNAVTGGGVKATIDVHKDNRYGDVVATTECGFDGSYTLELDAGKYVLEISAAGFIAEYFEINVLKGESKHGENYVLSPVLADGEIRIVLEWGVSPNDLDSHLIGRTGSGNNVHVSYQGKQARVSGELVAELDIDDTSSFGPETTTIYDINGVYEFKIHDFTNQSEGSSMALANSGAVVKVYMPGENQPKTFRVPSGNGVWWTVFKIEHGELIEINRMG